jgi:hypothetical protein
MPDGPHPIPTGDDQMVAVGSCSPQTDRTGANAVPRTTGHKEPKTTTLAAVANVSFDRFRTYCSRDAVLFSNTSCMAETGDRCQALYKEVGPSRAAMRPSDDIVRLRFRNFIVGNHNQFFTLERCIGQRSPK